MDSRLSGATGLDFKMKVGLAPVSYAKYTGSDARSDLVTLQLRWSNGTNLAKRGGSIEGFLELI